jgi:Tol biopolymer transport system component
MKRWALAALLGSALLLAGAAGASPGATGTLLFATGGDGVSDKLELASINADGSGFRKLTHLAAPGFGPRWSRDGRRIIFVTEDTFTENVANWRMRLDGGGRQRLPGEAWDVPSPNGNLVQIYDRIVDAKGKLVRRIRPGLRRDDFYGGPPQWSPDGRYITINVATETRHADYSWVDVVPTSGLGRGRAITPRRNGHFEGALSWSRDSRRMLIDVALGKGDNWYTITPEGRDRRRLLHLATNLYRDHAWSPDSRRIAYVGAKGDIYVIPSAGGSALRVAPTKSRGDNATRVYLDWSSKGEIAFSDTGGTYIVHVNGTGLHRLTERRGAPYWSPNGRTLVLSEANEIYVVPRRGPERKLTRWVVDSQPRWSPDARRIAFVRGHGPFDRARSVFVMNADGSGQRELGTGAGPRWSPDGTEVAFVEARAPPENDRIFVGAAEGGSPRAIAEGQSPTWSPDGRIAFMRYQFVLEDQGAGGGLDWNIEKSTLLTVRADGSDARVIAAFDRSDGGTAFAPRWSPDGERIALLLRDENGEGGVLLVDAVSGAVRTVTDMTPDSMDWSPDGGRLLAVDYLDVWLVDVATGAATKIRGEAKDDSGVDDATWSPDGTSVAFIRCTFEDHVCDVYAMEARAGARQRRLTKTPGIETGLDWAG